MLVIVIYCYIVIFGSWILKICHLPENICLTVIQFIDFLPFLILPWLFKVKKNDIILPNSITFWAIVFLFFILSIFSTFYHEGNLFASIAHFGAIFRFAPLALLICIIRPSECDCQLFYKHFAIISTVLLSIGYLEIIGGETMKGFFLPIVTKNSSANIKDSGDISGIFANTVDYAYFLVLSYIIITNRKDQHKQILLFIGYLILIFYTGSKAALIIFILCATYRMENIKAVRNIFLILILSCAVILIYQFWELFYWTMFVDSKASRLGYIIFTLPNFIQELSIDTLIGVSPDLTLVHQKINSYANAPMMTWDRDSMTSFEDEFYVAIPVYYGLIGFSLLVSLFGGMYRALVHAKWNHELFNNTIVIKSLFTILVIAPLFNQIIILKPFSIFFWCWIGILTTQMKDSQPS